MDEKRHLKLILKTSVSLFFVAWIIFSVQWYEVLAYIRVISIQHIFIFLALFYLGIFISAYKWSLLAHEKKINLSLYSLIKYYLTGALINNFMPSFLGGDAFRSYQTGKESSNRYAEATSVVLVDRITGFVAVMLLILIFSVLNFKTVMENPVLIVANLLIIISLGIDLITLILKKYSFWKAIKRYIPLFLLQIAREIRAFNSNKKTLIRAVGVGIIFNLVGVGMANYALFLALNIEVQMLDYLLVIFIISIISAIPISINNIGVKEWAYITFFGIFGLSSSAAATVAIISRFLQMIASFAALPAYLKAKANFNPIKKTHESRGTDIEK